MTALTTAHSPLSTAMREGSRAEHEAAEGSDFMSELLAGALNRRGYADLLVRLRLVYAALETAIRQRCDDPAVAAVHDSALERLTAIDADLEFWAPHASPDEEPSPAAAAYVARIQTAEWGGALVAHHYTRYLGDLSGGQAIGRVLSRTYDLDGAGVAFYEFAEIPKPKPYKDAYRARLDALRLSPTEVAEIVTEVKVAFDLNRGLFTELGERLADYRPT
jgi:heme oxygenase